MNLIGNYIKRQLISHKSVTPDQRWSPKHKSFFLNSAAGLLQYKPTSQMDAARFRDKYINRFHTIISSDGKDKVGDLFKLYAEIRRFEKVKYRANIRTRLEMLICGS